MSDEKELSLGPMSNTILIGDISDAYCDKMKDLELIEFHRQQRGMTIKNNILFVTIVNIFCLFGNTFAITFYQWYKLIDGPKGIWLNMLYVYSETQREYISYRNREQTDKFCSGLIQVETGKCYEAFHTLEVIGFVCFFLICVSLGLQIYDLVRMRRLLNFVNKNQQVKNKLKGRLIYALIILSQMSALIIYFFSVIGLEQTIQFNIDNFGASYWISVICNLTTIVFAIYYRWQKNRYHRFLVMEKLIDEDDLGSEIDLEN